MAEIWRLLDTGLATPARNIALNRALLEARRADEIPSCLRFARFTPCVLLGYRDDMQQRANVSFCQTHGVTLQRRITSGTAAYVDSGQLFWELYLHRRDVGTGGMRAVLKRICHAAAAGLSALGFDASFRPAGDIEVEGRTLSSAVWAIDGDALLVQSLLHVHVDVRSAAAALRLPQSQMGTSAIDLMCERVVGLDELLGREPDPQLVKHNLVEAFESEFDIELRESELGLSEEARYEVAIRQLQSRQICNASPAESLAITEAVHNSGNGSLRVLLCYDVELAVIRQLLFSANIAIRPRRALLDLEAAMRDVPLIRARRRVEWFFGSRPVDMQTLTPADFVAVLRRAVRHPSLARNV